MRACGRGPGGSWGVSGGLGPVWARSWRILDGVLEGPEAFGRVLGASWKGLWGVRGVLGRSWAAPGALRSIYIENGVGGALVLDPFGCMLGPFSDVFASIVCGNFNKKSNLILKYLEYRECHERTFINVCTYNPIYMCVY